MKPFIKAIVLVIVAAGVAVPSGYMAYEAFGASNPSMLHFIPLDSNFVMKFNYNNTTIYLFTAGNETGAVASLGISQVSSLLSSGNASTSGNLSSGVSIVPTYVETFHDYKIYSISNISISSAVGRNSSVFLNIYNSLNISRFVQNNTLYIAEISGSTVSLGSLSSVKLSILSAVDNTGFSRISNLYFNSTANDSFYVNYSNQYFSRASGNVYWNSSSFSLVFSNMTFATKLDQAVPLVLGSNLTKMYYSYPYMNLTIRYGLENLRTSANFSFTGFNGTIL